MGSSSTSQETPRTSSVNFATRLIDMLDCNAEQRRIILDTQGGADSVTVRNRKVVARIERPYPPRLRSTKSGLPPGCLVYAHFVHSGLYLSDFTSLWGTHQICELARWWIH